MQRAPASLCPTRSMPPIVNTEPTVTADGQIIPAQPPKRKRSSAKKAFDAYLKGRRGGKRPDLFIPKLSFQRLVHGIAARCRSDLRFQQEAIDILQETAEGLLVDRFQKCSRVAELCKVDTVRRDHWNFVCNNEGGGEGTLLG